VDVNAIILENRKKEKGASLATLSKMITKISLPQEGDIYKSVTNVDKPVAASNVVNKVIEVAIGEYQSLSNVDTKQIIEVEMLQEVVED
jgi:hypothetical protein